MHACQRIESSGLPGHIHCSEETAELLRTAGKKAWIEKRADNVMAKGKKIWRRVISTSNAFANAKNSNQSLFPLSRQGLLGHLLCKSDQGEQPKFGIQ